MRRSFLLTLISSVNTEWTNKTDFWTYNYPPHHHYCTSTIESEVRVRMSYKAVTKLRCSAPKWIFANCSSMHPVRQKLAQQNDIKRDRVICVHKRVRGKTLRGHSTNFITSPTFHLHTYLLTFREVYRFDICRLYLLSLLMRIFSRDLKLRLWWSAFITNKKSF